MTKEQIREKAFEFVSERASGTVKEMDYYAGILTEFATEVTKELQEENAELKSDNDARKFAMAMSEKVEKQLREENAELKTDYEVLSCSVGDFGELQNKLEEERSDLDMIAKNYAIKIADLEKENAELTDKNKALEQYADLADAKVDEVKYNLTKAEEIIKELVQVEYTDFTNSDYSNELSKVLEKAEQFLKEE